MTWFPFDCERKRFYGILGIFFSFFLLFPGLFRITSYNVCYTKLLRVAISAKAPHPEAARVFMDYWLSKDAMKLLADKVGEYVLAPGVFPPIDGISEAKVLPIRELSDVV